MVDFRSRALASRLSLWVTRVGNFPALLRPGPNNLGICLIKVSEAMKASYLAASFLTFFLSLFSFLRSSVDMASMPRDLASSLCCWAPSRHTLFFSTVWTHSYRVSRETLLMVTSLVEVNQAIL